MKYVLYVILLLESFIVVAQTANDRVYLKSDGVADVFYNYDSIGRIAQIRSSMYSTYESYVYRNDSILIYEVELPDSTLEKVYKLNKDGLADHVAIISEDEFYYEYYQYQNGMLLKKYHRYPINGQSTKYEINNGNNAKESFNDTSFQTGGFSYQQSTINYTYAEKQNTLQNLNFGQAFLGKLNSKLLNNSVHTSYISDVCSGTPCPVLPNTKRVDEYSYEYSFDAKGRIKQEIKLNDKTLKGIKTKYYYY